jgi:hypothetical protein
VKPSVRCRILIAVEPEPFVRLIEHVLQGHPGLQVVGRSPKSDSLAIRAGRLAPDVIIANTRLHRRKDHVLADLKRSSPGSRLILLTHDLDPLATGPEGPEAEYACLPEDAIVRRLLPVIRTLVARAGSHPLNLRSRAGVP